MSIASEITSIGENLKKDYQSIANLGADLTNVDKNIENIAELLDGVYDRLPKTEFEEGESVTLENTLKGRLDFDDGKVGFGQASQESTTGKNKLNYNDLTPQATSFSVDGNGNVSSTTGDNREWKYANSNWKMTLPAGTYTLTFYFSVQATSPYVSYTGCYIYNDSNSVIADFGSSFRNSDRCSKTITLANETNIGIFAKIFNGVCKVQLESGSTSTDWEKFTYGASPSPNWEQEIKYVRGKNLFNKATVTQRSYIDAQGVLKGADGTYCASDYIEVYQGSIVWSATTGNGYSLSIYDSSKTFIRSVGRTGNNAMIIPIANGEKYIRFTLLTADLDITQIEEGTQATPYLPYNTIEEVVSGKNEYSSENEQSAIDISNGATTEGYTNRIRSKDYIQINANTQYTISANSTSDKTVRVSTRLYDNSNTYLGSIDENWHEVPYTFTTLNNATKIKFVFSFSDNADITPNQITNVQLEEGSVIHTPTSYQLSLGDIELNAIGNYKDELIYDVDEDKVYKNEKIGKKRLIDSDYWADFSAYWGACSYGIGISTFGNKLPIAWSDMYCEYFKAYTVSQTKNLNNEIVVGSLNFIVNNQNTPTLSEFRNWLTSNPFYIYYQLATAVKEEITGTLKDQIKALYNAHSNNGTTIITSNGNLPMIIKVRGLKGE